MAQLQQLTLDNVISYLYGLTQHKQIKSFFYGPLYDLDINREIVYPQFGVVPQPSIIHQNYIEMKLRMYLVDKNEQDDSNRYSVHSQTFQTLLDLRAYVYKDFSQWLLPSDEEHAEPVWEQFSDYTAGWWVDLVLKFDNIGNVCDIPGLSLTGNTYSQLPYSAITPVALQYVQSVGAVGNLFTGGTALNPIIYITNNPDFYSVSATTISGGTLFSGSTNLYDIFATLSDTGTTQVQYWTSGSSGNFSVKTINDSGLDATGNYSLAEGEGTLSSGGYGSHAEGYLSTASGAAAHAEGSETTASNGGAHSEGGSTLASGQLSHAEGESTTSSGQASHAEGINSIASGGYSHAENQSTAVGDHSHSEGYGTVSNGTASHSEGYDTTASGYASHSGGFSTISNGFSSFVHGTGSTVNGVSSVVLGANITGNSNNTVYVPYLNIGIVNTGTSVINLGLDSNGNVVTGTTGGSFIDPYWISGSTGGIQTISNQSTGGAANGLYALAEGAANVASGAQSHAEGNATTASGNDSHSEGYETTAGGFSSHAEGADSTASGDYSHAEGYETTSVGTSSHSGGHGSIAKGQYSFVHGLNSTASGSSTVVFGNSITGNSSNTVYVPYLNISLFSSSTLVGTLGIDSSGNVISGTTGSGVQGVTAIGNLFTGGTILNPIIEISSAVTFASISGGTISGSTLISGSTNLYNIFEQIGSFQSAGTYVVSVGATGSLFTSGTISNPVININSGAFISSGYTGFVSTGTTAYLLSSTTYVSSVGSTGNITTGGTASNPTIGISASPNFSGAIFSGTVDANVVSATTLSATTAYITNSTISGTEKVHALSSTTFSAGTINSGTTNLYQIFQTIGGGSSGGIQSVGGIGNIYTGGTISNPTIGIVDSPNFNNITASGTTITEELQVNDSGTIQNTLIFGGNGAALIQNSGGASPELQLGDPLGYNNGTYLDLNDAIYTLTAHYDDSYFDGNLHVSGNLLLGATNIYSIFQQIGSTSYYYSTSGNPNSTTSLSGVMAGLSGSITPNVTGRIKIDATGDLFNTIATDGTGLQLRYGTGKFPTNGSNLTGTTTGGLVKMGYMNLGRSPFALNGIVTGLTVGTKYWIDIAQYALTGGTASFADATITAIEF